MALLPSFASPTSSNIADLFTKPLSLSRHRFTTTLIGDKPTTPSPSVASTVYTVTTASAAVDSVPVLTATPSDSVPLLHPNLVPIAFDTGASISRTSDFTLEIAQASYGLIRSPTLVVSDSKVYPKPASTVDPYTLITGEDTAITFDLSSPDTTTISDLSTFTKVSFDIREFGTATLTFIYSKSSELLHILVEPTQVDWIHWVPLPRLTPTESYFHIFGRDYLQAFALFHLIPIWIYLVHFAVNLD